MKIPFKSIQTFPSQRNLGKSCSTDVPPLQVRPECHTGVGREGKGFPARQAGPVSAFGAPEVQPAGGAERKGATRDMRCLGKVARSRPPPRSLVALAAPRFPRGTRAAGTPSPGAGPELPRGGGTHVQELLALQRRLHGVGRVVQRVLPRVHEEGQAQLPGWGERRGSLASRAAPPHAPTTTTEAAGPLYLSASSARL